MLNNNLGFVSNSFARRAEKMNLSDVMTLHNAGLLLGAGVAAGGLLYYMKPEKSDEVLEPKEQEARKRTKQAYGYVLGSFAITGASSYGLVAAGLPEAVLSSNPWACLGVGLAATVPLAIGTTVVDYRKHPVLKHVLWCGLNVTVTAGLATLSLIGGPVVSQACLATGCVVGGVSLLASQAAPESFKKYDAPLGVSLGGLVAIGLGNMIFPMSLVCNAALYGGMAVFGGLMLTDTGRLLERARNNEVFDPINESLGVLLDAANIFRKIALLVADLQNGVKKEKKGGDDAEL